ENFVRARGRLWTIYRPYGEKRCGDCGRGIGIYGAWCIEKERSAFDTVVLGVDGKIIECEEWGIGAVNQEPRNIFPTKKDALKECAQRNAQITPAMKGK
ncbi:MAG TPA: hypothetical protein VMW15_14705, partial [Terracidiphilus sp.]|nr:hypothetical protein [Terracidiphilus sp.]